jgi:predicted DNA-binding protein with PD1-like motif
MKYAEFAPNVYGLRLERGDDIHATLRDFCTGHGIANAEVSGIGSVEDPKLAHYSIESRHFTEQQFTGIYEIVSLLGNIALVEGEPFAHLHTTISDTRMTAHGGHLAAGRCSATLELIITAYPSKYAKRREIPVGLNVWQFSKEQSGS